MKRDFVDWINLVTYMDQSVDFVKTIMNLLVYTVGTFLEWLSD